MAGGDSVMCVIGVAWKTAEVDVLIAVMAEGQIRNCFGSCVDVDDDVDWADSSAPSALDEE